MRSYFSDVSGEENQHISTFCPYCLKDTFISLLAISEECRQKRVGVIVEDNQGIRWDIWLCQACGRPLLCENYRTYYPSPRPAPTNEHIPTPMKEAFEEAKICFAAGAYKATATMARLALQRACLNKGAKKGNLADQINKLYEDHTITIDIKKWADGVRYIGNDAAHDDDETIERADAEDALLLTEKLLEILYVNTAIATQQIAKRNRSSCT